MNEILRSNKAYQVELEEEVSQTHLPHRSWGTYRVIDERRAQVVFETTNRDKAFGVYEYLSHEAGITR